MNRSVSESLATKCLTVAATPSDCSPRTYAAPIRAVSSGSSLKHSKWRPPNGERWRLTVGASRMSTPLRRHSYASSRPSRSIRASSHVAASAVGDGTLADGSRSSQRSPRTPAGPSDMTIRRNPTAGSGCSDQKSAPVSRRTFCSRLSSSMTRQYADAMRALIFDVFGTCVDWRTSIAEEAEKYDLPPSGSPTPGATSTSRSWRRSATARGRG